MVEDWAQNRHTYLTFDKDKNTIQWLQWVVIKFCDMMKVITVNVIYIITVFAISE